MRIIVFPLRYPYRLKSILPAICLLLYQHDLSSYSTLIPHNLTVHYTSVYLFGSANQLLQLTFQNNTSVSILYDNHIYILLTTASYIYSSSNLIIRHNPTYITTIKNGRFPGYTKQAPRSVYSFRLHSDYGRPTTIFYTTSTAHPGARGQ